MRANKRNTNTDRVALTILLARSRFNGGLSFTVTIGAVDLYREMTYLPSD
jgi:hypothetical protein